MQYNKLGKSDLHINQVGFGCMSLGDDHLSNERLLHQAIHDGINYFDTADLYQKGFNEETVGRALKPFRDKVIACRRKLEINCVATEADGTGIRRKIYP